MSALGEDFLQFNAPRQLPLLDGTPQAARLVRFAPATARQALTEAVADGVAVNDVAWTASGETVGVIRLVPVRPGLLRANGTSAASAETVIAIEVTCGGDHAASVTAAEVQNATEGEIDAIVARIVNFL